MIEDYYSRSEVLDGSMKHLFIIVWRCFSGSDAGEQI